MNNKDLFVAKETLREAARAVHRIGNHEAWIVLMRLIVIAAFLFAATITFIYIQQPLVDSYAFRQTQTALTSYWMIKEGWDFAYQNPEKSIYSHISFDRQLNCRPVLSSEIFLCSKIDHKYATIGYTSVT